MNRFLEGLPLREKVIVVAAIVLPVPLALGGLAAPLLTTVERSPGSLPALESVEPLHSFPALSRETSATPVTFDDESGAGLTAPSKTAGDGKTGGEPPADGEPGATGDGGSGAGAPGKPGGTKVDTGGEPAVDPAVPPSTDEPSAGTPPVLVPSPAGSRGKPAPAAEQSGVSLAVDAPLVQSEIAADESGLGVELAADEQPLVTLDAPLPGRALLP